MNDGMPDGYAEILTLERDRKNLSVIDKAVETGRINEEAAEYLRALYSDSMIWFREIFHVLGKSFGAPKAPVMQYDYATDSAIDEPMKISDIHPLSPYVVQHRLDADPMRNQFFTSAPGHKIELSVSSIVTVIVAAQKKIERALDKITGKYYRDYVNDVARAAHRVLSADGRDAYARAISDKIHKIFDDKYITNASETVLSIIGRGHEKIAVEMVRALDKIEKPHHRLQDVWRVKCLFYLVPQARTFIERLYSAMPDRILSSRDKFYDMTNEMEQLYVTCLQIKKGEMDRSVLTDRQVKKLEWYLPRRKWILEDKKRISNYKHVMRWIATNSEMDGAEKRKKMVKIHGWINEYCKRAYNTYGYE